jgi:hypothetical protein
VRYYVLTAVAENPAPTGQNDALLYMVFTMEESMKLWLEERGVLLRSLTFEIKVMQDALEEQGVDIHTAYWECGLTPEWVNEV